MVGESILFIRMYDICPKSYRGKYCIEYTNFLGKPMRYRGTLRYRVNKVDKEKGCFPQNKILGLQCSCAGNFRQNRKWLMHMRGDKE